MAGVRNSIIKNEIDPSKYKTTPNLVMSSGFSILSTRVLSDVVFTLSIPFL